MFSIKVITQEGAEFVKSDVRTVSFNPPIDVTGKDASVFVWYANSEPAETFLEGKIYVMNENGKTVADYTLYPVKVVSKVE